MGYIDIALLEKRFRESGLQSNELAYKAKVCRGTIHNVMMGATTPSQYVAANLAEALELSDEDLIRIFFPKRKILNH